LELPGRRDAGGLRIRTYAAKDRSCADFPAEGADLLLDLDYTVILPRR
jgi:2-methylfumaryl-CoA hydratase